MNSELELFISQFKNINHSGSNLYNHLSGCYTILRNLNENIPEYVCNAAGLHSVYGTNIFKGVDKLQIDRLQIKQIFGLACEELVYLFSIINRPKALESNLVINRFTKEQFTISNETLQYLKLIEASNLIEQNYPLKQYGFILNTYKHFTA
jgi:hypothetical protein